MILVRVSHVTMFMSSNMLLIIILIVVMSILIFVVYYMGDDVSNHVFNIVLMMFLILILLILTSYGILMFLGWEGIGVMSILLIRYWMRPNGKSGAISAMIYNRWGDLVFLMLIYQVNGELIIILVIFAVICKSSVYLWGYWLPVAMERPTPVSSLLHSSTIVVSGVYLMILLRCSCMVLIVVLLLSINIVRHFDVKKNIAYSTSIHLLIILTLGITEIYSSVVMYILLHRMVKGSIFQISRYSIHRGRVQDVRMYSLNGMVYIILVGMFLLSAVVRTVLLGAKELVVFRVMRVIILVLVILSYVYTLGYANKIGRGNFVGEFEGWYVKVVMISSMCVVIVNFSDRKSVV